MLKDRLDSFKSANKTKCHVCTNFGQLYFERKPHFTFSILLCDNNNIFNHRYDFFSRFYANVVSGCCLMWSLIIFKLVNRIILTKTKSIYGKEFMFVKDKGKRSELQISQRRKPKRTSKNLETITTLKRFIKVIRTSKKEKIRTSKSQ